MSDRPFGSPSRPTRLLDEITPVAELMLITSMVNVRYLTGFTGSAGAVLIGPDTRVFLTDFRYREQSAVEVPDTFERCIVSGDIFAEIGRRMPGGELRLGFEDDEMTVRDHAKLGESLPDHVTLVAAGSPTEALRMVKDAEEIARIRAAAQLADAALREVMEQGLAGRTEAEVARAIEDAMRRRGASGASFETIVAAGPHGALPHANPRNVVIGEAELVVIDWGAVLDGYCSDCTRTFATGELPESAQVVYDLVRAAQLVGLDAVRPGADGRDVDAAARATIEAAGHGEHFGHSLGHGVGLEVHELPRLSQRSQETLAPGNIVTVEPGVYLPGAFGVRIEDLCLVTESGCEILTDIPKELITVG
jgi:Xaa-Pro aminopeptidase